MKINFEHQEKEFNTFVV